MRHGPSGAQVQAALRVRLAILSMLRQAGYCNCSTAAEMLAAVIRSTFGGLQPYSADPRSSSVVLQAVGLTGMQ